MNALDTSTLETLLSFRKKGIDLWLEEDQLRYEAPKGILVPELLASIRAKKEEIIAFLQRSKQLATAGPLFLVGEPRPERLPLSYVQERLWLVQQRDGGSSYNMSGALVLNGPLSMQALEAALKGLIERHEPLRTRFVWEAGESAPQQYIDASVPAVLSVRKARGEEVTGLVKEHAGQIFDLAQGPQLSVLVLELGPEEHVLSLAMHHIIGDGWSVHVLVRDLQELYAAATEGRAPRLEPLKLQYADYALWQRQLDLSKGLEYWRSALSGYEGPFDLAPERPRGKNSGFAGVVRRTLSPELASRLWIFSQERQASLFMVLLSGWALAVHRQTGQKDLCLGTTVAGREQLALEPLIGFFINILGLRFDLTGERSGEELVEQVKEVVLEGLAHQAVPFEHVLAAMLELRQENGATPLPVMVRHQNFPEAELQQWALGLEARPLSIEQKRRAKSDLDLQYYGDANGLWVVAEFDTDRFDAEQVEALLIEVEQLLGRLIDSPQLPLWQLVELSSEERAELERWNDSEHTFERVSVTELFARRVERDREGLACVDSEQSLTYEELDRRSNSLARLLQQRGVREGVRVALYLPRSADFLVALLAVWKVGGVYVGIDRSYPEAYAQRIIEDAKPAIILVESGFVPGFSIELGKVLAVEEALLQPESKPLEQRVAVSPDELAYIAYTSGSTGQPKGVCVEHRQLLNCLQALWERIPFAADEVVAQKTATTFVVSLKELLSGLLAGIPQVMISDVAVRDTEAFAAELERQRVTRLNVVPSQLAALLEYAERLKGLRHVITAGEPLGQSLRERFEQLLPNARLYNNYGCTELNDIAYCLPGYQDDEGGLVPMGGPISNLKLHVLDEQQRLVPLRVTGELYVEGKAVGSGYWNQPALTAERFAPNPFGASGSRLFRTGDLVRRRADGQLQYIGREDFQIKIRGQRVELAQVEQALAEHPVIQRCAVMGQNAGNEEACLVAYYVAVAGTELTYNQLHSWLRERLPAYMVPALYVPMEKLPLLPNGKLNRLALPVADTQSLGHQEYQEPQGEIERAIAGIWADVLKLPVERISRHDNFFSRGGNSISAVRVAERMRRAGLHAEIAVLFGQPTLAALAEAVGTSKVVNVPPNGIPAAGCEEITPEMLPLVSLTRAEIESIASRVPGGAGNIQDIYPLVPLQEGVLFHHLASSQGDPHLLDSMFAFESREYLESFLSALQAVANRHDVLRTAVLWEGLREPVQVVWRSAPLPVEEVRVADSEGDVSEQLRLSYGSQQQRLDLTKAPLLRVYVAEDKPNQRWVVFLLFHHFIMDRATAEVVQQEIAVHLGGEAETLLPAVPYRNFVAQALLGVSQQEHDEFFRSMLADVEQPTSPFGFTWAQGSNPKMAVARRPVDSQLASRLRVQARTLGVSVASLFHLAWAHVLAVTSGRDDVVFGTVLLGRMQAGLGADRALGMFINTLPMRIRTGEEGVRESVLRTSVLLSDLLRHEHASLVQAQGCSGVAAPAPLFYSLLNFKQRSPSEQMQHLRQSIEPISADERVNHPFTVLVDDMQEDFRLTLYTPAFIDPERICGFMSSALSGLVEALENSPGMPMHSVCLLSTVEREQVLYGWNETETQSPVDQFVHVLFEEQVERTPDAIAVSFAGTLLTYAQLNQRANRLAHYLREIGVKPDTRVALCLERSPEMVMGLLAVLKAGGAYVPLDPGYPEERLQFMLKDSAPVALLTKSALRTLLETDLNGLPLLELDGDGVRWGKALTTNLPVKQVGLSASHLAYVIYTSGSTGKPKGVMVQHQGLSNYLLWAGGFYAPEGSVVSSSLSFDATITSLLMPLSVGGTVRLLGEKREFVELEGQVRRGCGLIKITPALLEVLGQKLLNRGAVSSAEIIVVGGEALPASTVALWRKIQPNVRMVNEYGPTETVVGCVVEEISSQMVLEGWVPIGRPIANTQIYVLDEQGEPAPVGVTGELYIGGAGVARGYVNRPELTAERFLPDPFNDQPGARMYKSGDLGRWRADGGIEYLGRNDAQVKVRGFRIELGEIEVRVAELTGVQQAVVLMRQDTPGDKRLVTYYTADPEVPLSPERMRDQLASRLPDYMVPAAYVRLEAMPLTPNGKLDRQALPAPDADSYRYQEYQGPEGEIEQTIAAIWAGVLELPVDRIGRHDNFFALGGNSLLVVRVVERMRQAGLHADIAVLFGQPTLRASAEAVGKGKVVNVPPNRIPAEGCEAITPEMLPLVSLTPAEIESIASRVPGGAANIQDIYPLAPLQEGILFHHLLGGKRGTFVLRLKLSFDTRARLESYLQALQSVIDRHDILRTAVLWEGLPEPVQVVLRKARLPKEEVELKLGSGDVAAQLEVHCNQLHGYRLDVRQAPLLRALITYDSPQDRWLMILQQHQLISDHTAWDIVQQEIGAHLRGEAETLPAAVPYRNFVAQARLGVSQEEHEKFFREMLGDVEEPTAPLGILDVHGDGSGIEAASLMLDSILALRLREQASRLGVSPASIWHLAWARVLGSLCGSEDVVFGTVLFGRMQAGEGADRALGMLINALPIRIPVGGEGVRDGVIRTHQLLSALLPHEHALLAQAQRCSAVPAPLPLFTAILNYRHTQARMNGVERAPLWEGIEVQPQEERINYPFTLAVDDLGQDFFLAAHVPASIDPNRVGGFVRTVLADLVDALENVPDKPVHSLEVLPDGERYKIEYEWNDTAHTFERLSVTELFARQVQRNRESLACMDSEQTLTYEELDLRSNSLARLLQERGVRQGVRVALYLARGVDFLTALLAVWKARGGYVGIDRSYPEAYVRGIVEDARPAIILVESGFVPGFTIEQGKLLALEEELLKSESGPLEQRVAASPDELAYIAYTSGSTGQPKGVCVEHRQLLNCLQALWEQIPFATDEVVAQKTATTFVVSLKEMLGGLLAGIPQVILSDLVVRDTEAFAAELERTRVTRLNVVPSQLAALLEYAERLKGLRHVITAGEPLSQSLRERFEQLLPEARLYNNYGCTELNDITYCLPGYQDSEGGLVPMGGPISNLKLHVLDEQQRLVPVGVTGELCVEGEAVGSGYWNQPALTAERFAPNPFGVWGGRLFRTGDLVRRRTDGQLQYIGRQDFQIKIRGQRIELAQVEQALTEHPAIKRCAVMGQDTGSERACLVAYYVAAEPLAYNQLHSWLRERLPAYMVPALYMPMERLPLLPNGKLDRLALPAADIQTLSQQEYQAPEGEIECAIATIWAEILKLPVEHISRHDNFFALGGHSLLATRVIARLRSVFEVEMEVGTLFEAVTIQELAKIIHWAAQEKISAAIRESIGGEQVDLII